MNKIKSLSQHPFIRGSFVFTAATFFVNILSYVFNLFVARGMSLADYGEYSSSISYLSLFAVPLGTLSLIVIKKVGSVAEDQRAQYISFFEQKFFLFLKKHWKESFFLSIVAVYFMVTRGNLRVDTSVFVLVAAWVTLYLTFYNSILFALKKFFQNGWIQVLQGIGKVLLGGIIIYFIPRLDFLYGVLLVTTVLGVYLMKKELPKKVLKKSPSLSIPHLTHLVRKPEYYIPLITSFGTVGMINADLILVKKFFSADEVGFYAAISLLGKIILYVATPITAVAYTFFTGKENTSQKNKIFLFSTVGLIGVGIVSVIGYTVFSHLIVSIIFGSKFESISYLLTLAAVFGGSYSVMTLFSQYLLSVQSKYSMLSFIAFLIQIVLLIIYHSNFKQILLINIFSTIGLFFIYLLVWLHHSGVLYGGVKTFFKY